jgi:hypothetical protein
LFFNYPKTLNAIIKPYIATTSISATNSTINDIILPLISGDLFIESIAPFISNHSPTQAPKPANQIANQAHRAAALAHSKANI